MESIRYPIVEGILNTAPPARLYHYTSPAGLIGIATTRTLWATNVRYLNDTAELEEALGSVRGSIHARLRGTNRALFSEAEHELLQGMLEKVGEGAYGVYVAALTQERDDLSQWRAYCPASGGYAFGIATSRVKTMAAAQGFYLTPCVYEHDTQQQIVNDLVNQRILQFRQRMAAGEDAATVRGDLVDGFGWDTTKYCAMLKHRAFKNEREWRLVSPFINLGDARIFYRPGRTTIVPYVKFSFLERRIDNFPASGSPDESFEVVVGPTIDSTASQLAVQAIMFQHVGVGCWHGRTDAPFRE